MSQVPTTNDDYDDVALPPHHNCLPPTLSMMTTMNTTMWQLCHITNVHHRHATNAHHQLTMVGFFI
jgi:hypothetical protein